MRYRTATRVDAPGETLRSVLVGHVWVYTDAIGVSPKTGWLARCECGWESLEPGHLHALAAFAKHLTERMYAATLILDDCDREFTSSHTPGDPIRVRRLVPDGELEANDA